MNISSTDAQKKIYFLGRVTRVLSMISVSQSNKFLFRRQEAMVQTRGQLAFEEYISSSEEVKENQELIRAYVNTTNSLNKFCFMVCTKLEDLNMLEFRINAKWLFDLGSFPQPKQWKRMRHLYTETLFKELNKYIVCL